MTKCEEAPCFSGSSADCRGDAKSRRVSSPASGSRSRRRRDLRAGQKQRRALSDAPVVGVEARKCGHINGIDIDDVVGAAGALRLRSAHRMGKAWPITRRRARKTHASAPLYYRRCGFMYLAWRVVNGDGIIAITRRTRARHQFLDRRQAPCRRHAFLVDHLPSTADMSKDSRAASPRIMAARSRERVLTPLNRSCDIAIMRT